MRSNERTLQEYQASYDKMMNVLIHDDWREIYLYLAEERVGFQDAMNTAPTWEKYLVARAQFELIGDLMQLPEKIKAAKTHVDREVAMLENPKADVLDAPLYESDTDEELSMGDE